MARCRSCDAPVLWARTTKGKNIPLDAVDQGGWDAPDTFKDGNVRPTGERAPGSGGQTVMVVEVTRPGTGKYRAHWASCSHPEQFRRRR